MSQTDTFVDLGPQIGRWLRAEYQGSRAKNVAREFSVSEATAKRWLGGSAPTTEHLGQMARLWGWKFLHFVMEPAAGPVTPYVRSADLEDLHARLARLEEANGHNAPHASMADRSAISPQTGEAQALGEISPRQGRLVGSVPASPRAERLAR